MNDSGIRHGISHDKVFKTLFRTFFKDLVELVHPGLAGELDLDHHQFLDAPGFADLRKHGHVVPDVLVKTTTLSGEPRLVLVHVEAENEFANAMDDRMEEYFMQCTLEYKCPVISIVVFRKGGEPGVERREVVRKVGGWICNRFSYLAFGLSGSLAEEYVHRPQPLAAALAAMMRSRLWDNLERRLECLRAVRRADVGPQECFLLTQVVTKYIELNESERARFAAELEKRSNEEVQKMVLTYEETMADCEARGRAKGEALGIAKGEALGIAKGEALGIAKGEALGIAKGEAQGRRRAAREAVVRVLEHRWSPLPSWVLSRLEAVEDPAHLQDLLTRALEVRSIEDLDL